MSFRYKDYTFPNGRMVKYQGYEHLAFKELIEHGIDENDIICAKVEVPKISYRFGDINRVYYPDIFLPKQNKIIEVKSDYTILEDSEKNLAKRNTSISAGYTFEFWIYDRHEKRMDYKFSNA